VSDATEPASESKSLSSKMRDEFSFIRGNFLIILVGWLLIDFSREMAYTYYPLYVQALGGGASIVGLIGSAAMITEAIIKIPGGYLADKYGRKKLIIVMTFMASFAYLLYVFAPSWHFVLAGAVLTSLCMIYTPAFDSMVIESLPEERRGTGYSMINLITRVSTTPSPLLAGVLLTAYGLTRSVRIGFLAVSAAFLIASLLRTKLEEGGEKEEINARELVRSFQGGRSFVEGLRVWGEVPRSLVALLAVELLFIVPNAIFNTSFIFFMVQDLGITELQISYLGAIIGVFVILLAIPSGKVIDRVGRKKPLLLGFLLSFAIIPFLYGASFEQLVVITPLVALTNVIFYTAIQALYADLIPEENRGRVSGSKDSLRLIGFSVGQILGGYIYDYVSHTLPTTIFWVSMVPVFFLTLFFVEEPDRNKS